MVREAFEPMSAFSGAHWPEVHGSGGFHARVAPTLFLCLPGIGEPRPLLASSDALLFASVASRLVLAAASGPGVAVVVTVNCFLAKFCSAFGRYLTLDRDL